MFDECEARRWAYAYRYKLTTRVFNCVYDVCGREKVQTLEDLQKIPDAIWLSLPNFGEKSLRKLRALLPGPDASTGLSFFNANREAHELFRQAERLEALAQDLREVANTIGGRGGSDAPTIDQNGADANLAGAAN